MANENGTGRKAEVNRPKTLLTIADVAALDGCCEKTVRRAIEAGQLRTVRIGPGRRSIRIHPDDHAAYRHGHR